MSLHQAFVEHWGTLIAGGCVLVGVATLCPGWLSRMIGITSLVVDGPYSAGVIDCRDSLNPNGIAVRLFYPSKPSSGSGIRLFKKGIHVFVSGYVHTFLSICRYPSLGFRVASFVTRLVSFFLPCGYATVPSCTIAAPLIDDRKPIPLLIFSHGLTGTNEEHAILATSLARCGFAVACLHHQDGSSSLAFGADGTPIYYEHPDFKAYSADFRPKQIEKRVRELDQAYEYLLSERAHTAAAHSSAHADVASALAKRLDRQRVLVGGFSYGAATAALAATRMAHKYQAAVLLDGWFCIDLSKLKAVASSDAFDFPAEAHKHGLPIPALFVGSEQFANMGELAAATQRLIAKTARAQAHTLVKTSHWNFNDVVAWLQGALFFLKMTGAVGKCDALRNHRRITELVIEFCSTTLNQ